MTSQFPVFGQQVPDTDPVDDPVDDPAPRSLDPRLARSLLAGAAALIVVGGGAAGFVWLSSPPTAIASGAFAGSSAGVPSATATTSAPRVEGAGFVASARSLFGTATAASGDLGPAATGTPAASGTTAAPVAPGATAGGSTSGAVPERATADTSAPGPVAPSSTTAPAPAAPAPTPAAPAPVTTPRAEQAWTAPDIRLYAADATTARFCARDQRISGPLNAKVGSTSTVFAGLFSVASTEV